MEAEKSPAVGAGEATAKTAASEVVSLFREMGQLVAPSRSFSFISLVFILAFPFFCFR